MPATTRQYLDIQPGRYFAVSRYASLNEAITAIGATECYLIIDVAIPTAGNVTIPDNVHLVFLEGGDFTGTDTVTVQGPSTHLEKGVAKEVAFAPDSITFPAIGKYIRIQRGGEADASDYGIRGVGDESTKMQNLCDAVGDAGGGSILIPHLYTPYTMNNVRVKSFTTIKGQGNAWPFFPSGPSGTQIVSGSHSGEKAIFYTDDDGDIAGDGFTYGVRFKNLTLRGPGDYDSQATLGINFTDDAIRCSLYEVFLAGFTRQAVRLGFSNAAFSASRFEYCMIFGAAAPVGALSAPIGALELHAGENFFSNLEVTAGHNQDYGGAGGTDLFMCTLLDKGYGQWAYNCAFDFGDIGAWLGPSFQSVLSRAGRCYGHCWYVKEHATGGFGVPSFGMLSHCRATKSVDYSHASNMFDGFHLDDTSGLIGGWRITSCHTEGGETGVANARYGFYEGGPYPQTTDPTTSLSQNRNAWIDPRADRCITGRFGSADNARSGPQYYTQQEYTVADGDETPSVQEITLLFFNDSGATNTTDLDDGTPWQKVHVIDFAGNRTFIQGANIKNKGNTNKLFNAGEGATYFHRAGVWYEV